MKLTRLRLLGFKSFVEPTDFLIEPGLTGVVGPNGCGKSNLVEALRWVMGETSHKSLRAADMDDVIFAGTNGRPSRNNAEVAMHIDNTQRKAPAQFNEHEALDITRRIEREKGSSYRINGREVRARDVHILFADASTGSRSPALVHQGRIGEIIQAKPEQRRRVLEEAAGISGLHARRHEAELRLRAAEQNLARIEDVINQLGSQVDSLKKQARQAVRYRNIASQVRTAEATLFHLRWIGANAELAEAEQGRNLAVRVVGERTGAQAQTSTRQAEASSSMPPLREAEARAAAALQRLVIARETLEQEETRARNRMAELDQRLIQLDADIERERRLTADAEAALARFVAEEATLQSETNSNATKRTDADARVAEADTVLAASEKTFAELTGTLADLTARRNQLQTAIDSQSERRKRLDEELSGVEGELTQLGVSTAGRPDLVALSQAADAAQAAVAEAEAVATRAEAAHSGARQAIEVAREPLLEAERRVQRLDTEAKTLAKLLHVDTKSLWPSVIDDITVAKGYEAALGAALGDDLEAPVDPSSPMRWGGAAIEPDDPRLPDGVEALAQHVQAPPELARRLTQIGVIDRADAPRYAMLIKPGQRLVSRDGDLWRWDGFSVAANAPTGAARRLAGKNRLADIEAELQAVRVEVDSKRSAVAAAEADVRKAEEAEHDARAKWRDLQHAASAAREQHANAEREAGRDAARVSALTEARTRLVAGRDEAAAAQNEAERTLADMPPAADIETKLGAVRGDIETHRVHLAEVRAEAQARAREAELAARRLAQIGSEREGWTSRRDGAASQLATLEQRVAEATVRTRRPQRCAGRVRREAHRADQRDRNRRDDAARRRRPPGRSRECPRRRRQGRPRGARSRRRRARGRRPRRRALRRGQPPPRRHRARDP